MEQQLARPKVSSVDSSTQEIEYKEILHDVSIALHLDEVDDGARALSNYAATEKKIKTCLSNWPKSHEPALRANLEQIHSQIKLRLTTVEKRLSDRSLATARSAHTNIYPDLEEYLDDGSVEDEGDAILYIPSGVQMYNIGADGHVTLPSYPTYCRVTAPTASKAIVNIGDQLRFPLEKTTPVLVTPSKEIIVPHPEKPGINVAVSVKENAKALIDTIAKFCDMRGSSQTKGAPPRPPPPAGQVRSDMSPAPSAPAMEVDVEPSAPLDDEMSGTQPKRNKTETVSAGIVYAAEKIGSGIRIGAEKGGELLSKGGSAARAKMKPADQAKPVDPKIQQGLVAAHAGTHVVAVVTSAVVDKVAEATVSLGQYIAPKLQDQANKYLPTSWTQPSEPGKQSKLDKACMVASAGAAGVGAVWVSLEAAATSLGRSVAGETTATVEHRYGPECAKATHNGMYAAGNCVLAYTDVRRLGVKALAKRATKDTGVALLGRISDKNSAAGRAV